MGAKAGIFKMRSEPEKTADSADLKKQESDLTEAYAQSASLDKTIAAEFDVTLADGLAIGHETDKGGVITCLDIPQSV